jgi:hypothetical protein
VLSFLLKLNEVREQHSDKQVKKEKNPYQYKGYKKEIGAILIVESNGALI